MNPVDEIKKLYLQSTAATIQRDLARAVTLLKSLGAEEERQRAAVYMDGLSQMRSEWAAAGKLAGGSRSTRREKPRRSGSSPTTTRR